MTCIFLSEENYVPSECVEMTTVADQGFPWGGGANFPGGQQHTILPNFPQNCMKLKEFGPWRGHMSLAPPLDPPLDNIHTFHKFNNIFEDIGKVFNNNHKLINE